MSAKERLAKAMEEAGCPQNMIDVARAGLYDDFESDIAFPLVTLVTDLTRRGFGALAQRARDGEFDSTKEEAEAWFKKEGKDLP